MCDQCHYVCNLQLRSFGTVVGCECELGEDQGQEWFAVCHLTDRLPTKALKAMSASFGESCLYLSGGGMLGMYHLGLLDAYRFLQSGCLLHWKLRTIRTGPVLDIRFLDDS